MENKPLISIITVCYNSEKTIKDTIESVLNQTYTNIEYILIDGNSSDSTVEIIKSYEVEAKEKGIIYRWISEPDKGIYDAMNKGIDRTAGELIGIINSDDWYELNAIKKIVNIYIKDVSIDILHGNIIRASKEKETLGLIKPGLLKKINKGMQLHHPTCFVKKKYYEKYGMYDINYKLASDYKFIIEAYSKNKAKFYYLDNLISYMRVDGATEENINLSWKECHKIRIEMGVNLLISIFYYYLLVVKRKILEICWRYNLKKKYADKVIEKKEKKF